MSLAMDAYYKVLGVSAQASPEQLEEAYRQQRDRYSPERVAALGEDFRRIAEQRIAEIDRAYAMLTRQHTSENPPRAAEERRSKLTRREILVAIGGGLLGLLVIAVVWMFSGQSATTTRLNAAQQNRPAPNFTLPTLDGQPVELEAYRGKIVLVNFWYTGCEPCREETPALEAAYKKLGDKGLEIIGVNVRMNERTGAQGDADIRKFMDDHGVTYPIALDGDNAVNRNYQVYVLPTSVMIDRNGQIRYLLFSAVTTDEVEALFNTLQSSTTES